MFHKMFKRWSAKNGTHAAPPGPPGPSQNVQQPRPETPPGPGLIRRVSRKVVPGLPRAKTFKRQQSENREKLEPTLPTPAERRAVSVDRRTLHNRDASRQSQQRHPRASAPDFLDDAYSTATPSQAPSVPSSPIDEKHFVSLSDTTTVAVAPTTEEGPRLSRVISQASSTADAQSVTTSQYETMIHDDLEKKWILNLSMHFRDKSKREKFFVTYREEEFRWRRVTISLDYRDAPDDSLEKDLFATKLQREKSAKIYEAIRESLQDIQFYETVTNLKLQTTDGRLHVHVVEDNNEIIHYPPARVVQHLKCRRVRDRDLEFVSHMSGFVYKVRVDGKTLIKKEIPGPDTVDEFLYEVNALNSLAFSQHVIEFYGVVVDNEENVRGLLIDYADKGALIDVIYDSQENGLDLSWATREKWARQIVEGLSDIHEAGFVQGDFTLSNIVIDDRGNAKIIDINRRGCPVGWEPPEATPLLDSNQRISMYIGVKSDLYQLGMVLWALATLEDEPEAHRRPLRLDREIDVPVWYRRMVENCLHENPRVRLQATALLAMFPEPAYDHYERRDAPAISVDDGYSLHEYLVDGYERDGRPQIRTVTPQNNWGYSGVTSPGFSDDSYYYPPRGRSPPSPLPSNHGNSPCMGQNAMWPENHAEPSSVTDTQPNELRAEMPKDAATLAIADVSVDKAKGVMMETSTDPLHQPDETPGECNIATHVAIPEPMRAPQVVVEEVEETSKTPVGFDESLMGDHATPTGRIPGPQGPDAAQLEPEKGFAAEATRTGNLPEPQGSDAAQLSPEEASVNNGVGLTGGEVELDKGGVRVENTGTTESADHPPGDTDTESGPNYIHHKTENTYMRTTATEAPSASKIGERDSPSREIPKIELTGIGSAYETQEEVRQPIFSDEDLGFTPVATASQNVASQA